MIKAVLFDLDDTLFNNSLQVSKAREKAICAMISAGLKKTKLQTRKALAEIVDKKGPNHRTHYDDLLTKMGLEPDPKIVAAGVIAYHEAKRKYLVPFSDARRTLDALRKKGYKLGVVSNGIPVKQWEKLIRLNLQRHFDVVIIATAKHELKPSPKAFLAAAKRLGVRPDEVVFVGDRPEKDIKGANRAGMISVQLISGMDCPELPQGRQQEPDIIIRRLTDLPRAIDSL